MLITWSAKGKCILMIRIKGSVIAVHAMKAYGGNRVIVKPILNFGTRWRFGLPHAPVTIPPGKAPHSAYWLGSWIGPRARMDDLKEIDIFVLAGIQTANLPTRIFGTILTAVDSDHNSSYRFLVCVSLFEMLSWLDLSLLSSTDLQPKVFAPCPSHPSPLVQQFGNYTPANLTDFYRKYKHKRLSIYCHN
jgi:hypothetical protein